MAGNAGLGTVEELSFKDASVELELVVRALESGELELEDALEKYARGVALLTSLRERLSKAEQKVQVLLDASDAQASVGDVTAAPSTAFLNE